MFWRLLKEKKLRLNFSDFLSHPTIWIIHSWRHQPKVIWKSQNFHISYFHSRLVRSFWSDSACLPRHDFLMFSPFLGQLFCWKSQNPFKTSVLRSVTRCFFNTKKTSPILFIFWEHFPNQIYKIRKIMFFPVKTNFSCFWTQNEPSISLIYHLLAFSHKWDSQNRPPKHQNDHEKSIFHNCSRNVPGTPKWCGVVSCVRKHIF